MAHHGDEDGRMTPLDKSGHEITVGAYIVYGHALGRCAGLRFGKVLAIKPKAKPRSRLDSQWSITVIGYDDDALMAYNRVCDRTGTLGYPDRIMVIPRGWLTDEIKSALDSFVLKKGPQ
jgi:hypothetical protein